MTKFNWEEIQLYRDVHTGLKALEKLTGEKPTVNLPPKALAKWDRVGKMQEKFYELDIQERLYESGMATRPKEKA